MRLARTAPDCQQADGHGGLVVNNQLDDHLEDDQLEQEFLQLVQRLTPAEKKRLAQEMRRLLALQQLRQRLPEQGGTH